MELQKSPVNINFQGGLDLKTDPYQVAQGKFLSLTNTVFDKLGRLTKRSGFGTQSTNGQAPKTINTFKSGLVSFGNTSVASYDAQLNTWAFRGNYAAASINTVSVLKNNSSQTYVDAAIYGNLSCVVYSQTTDFSSYTYNVVIVDTTDGHVLTTVRNISTFCVSPPRVFLLGTKFIIMFQYLNGLTAGLWYSTVDALTLSTTTITPFSTDIASSAVGNPPFDGVVASDVLYVAWKSNVFTQVNMASMTTSLVISSTVVVDTGHLADLFGVAADTTQGSPIIWVGFWGAGGDGYLLAVDTALANVVPAKHLITGTLLRNLTVGAVNATGTLVWEVRTSWQYDANIENSNLAFQTVLQSGTVLSSQVLLSYGLGSKAFIIGALNGYVVATYGTPEQPSYFVINISRRAVTRFAYSNGVGFLNYGLPSVTVSGTTITVPYLFKDLIKAVNKETAPNGFENGIYSQTGINLAAIEIGRSQVPSVDSENSLNISGGFLWQYDGNIPTENNFLLYPELINDPIDGTYHGAAVDTTPVVTTGNLAIHADIIGGVASLVGIYPGMGVSDSGGKLPAGTIVLEIYTPQGSVSPLVKISKTPSASVTAATLTFTGSMSAADYEYQFIYQWTNNQGNIERSAPSTPVVVHVASGSSYVNIAVPCLNLTYKTANPIIIVGYRWSPSQEIFYQFTSITQPVYNDTTAQIVTIPDAWADENIVGNDIIYTTGGILENFCPPSTSIMSLFDNRLWMVNNEDRNLLYFSKSIIEATPIEMSPLLTYFVPPTIGGQGSTGDITALAAMDDKLIIFKNSAIYYINGSGPNDTGANSQYSQPLFVTSPVGCANQASITQVPAGLMFQAANGKGIWLLGRDLIVKYIGDGVEDYNSYAVLWATTIPNTNQVRFGLSGGPILMYDYYVNQWGTFAGLSSVSCVLYQGLATLLSSLIGNSASVYQETPGVYADGATPVAMSFTTSWLQIGGLRGYQRSYFLFYLGTYLSSHRIQTDLCLDYDSTIVQTDIITPDSTQSIEQERIFFKYARCKAFRLTFTELISTAGAGLTLSGINVQVGFKKSFAPSLATRSIG